MSLIRWAVSFLVFLPALCTAQIYLIESGTIRLRSDAPLELIEATNTQFNGAIDLGKQTFLMQVVNIGFKGFNSPLQQEHFHENYLETSFFPKSTFQGKLIEPVDLTKTGVQTIRAKGKLNIHGVAQERIIKANLIVKGNTLVLESQFTVLLEEHNISIPKIVKQKIAEEIYIDVQARLLPKS